jgi:ABC-2 type transport system permease protein
MTLTIAGATRAACSPADGRCVGLLVAAPVVLGLLAVRSLATVERTANVLEMTVIRAVLPLVALVFGTSAIGAELEDGTAIHLLTKPVARWRIVAGKLLAAAPVTVLLVSGSVLATGLLIGGERGTTGVTLAFTVASAIGAVLYVSVFIALSILTSRALIVGLVTSCCGGSGPFEGFRAST